MTKTRSSLRVFTVLAATAAAMILAVLVISFSYAPAEAQSAEDILKQPPFEPTDVNLFDPAVYSSASPMQPDTSDPTDEATLSGQLSDLLEQRFPSSPKKVNSTLALFDSAKAKQIVPDPRLRAG
jgi:ABC-type transport system substrate-binding protein